MTKKTVADVLAARSPRTTKVRLILDGVSSAELEALKNDLSNLRLQERVSGANETLASQIPLAERRIAEAEAELIKNTVEFTFAAIGRGALDTIKAKYPPSPKQWELFHEQSAANPLPGGVSPPTFDGEAMAAEFLSAAAVDPEMTVEEAEALWDALSDGEAAVLWNAAWSVNMEAATVPLSVAASERTGSSEETLGTRRVMESLGRSLTEES